MSGRERLRVTRRAFIQRLGASFAFLLFPFQQWLTRESKVNAAVLCMRPITGLRYSHADRNHMANRIFVSREAIMSALPHRGLIFAIAEVAVGMSREELLAVFPKSGSLDRRRGADQHSYQAILKASKRTALVESA